MSNETRTESKTNTYLMARIAIITALLCVLAPFSIPIPFSPVPLSLTNFVIFLGLFVLSWKPAAISVEIYLLIGIAGLPVFSGFSGGFAKIAGPTGGYLIGFIPLVIMAGIMMSRGKDRSNWYLYYAIGAILGEAVLYVFGTAWLSYTLGVGFIEGLFMGVIPYLPGDIVKIALAAKIGHESRKAITKAMGKDPLS